MEIGLVFLQNHLTTPCNCSSFGNFTEISYYSLTSLYIISTSIINSFKNYFFERQNVYYF